MKPLKTLLGRSTPTTATLDRVWAGIKQRESARRRWSLELGLGVGALVAAGVVGFVVFGLRAPVDVPAVAVAPVALVGDSSPSTGVRVAVGERAEAWFAHGGVQVSRGVVKVTARVGSGAPLEVTAGTVRVQVAAAVVRVEVMEHGVSLVVEEGEVVVRPMLGAAQTVRAGASWTDRVRDWRALARAGELAEAWAVLGPEGVTAAGSGASLEDQTLLADIAASGGARRQAIGLLEHAIAVEGTDRTERAVAAYDLGLRYVEEGEPRLAAQVFERSIALDLPVALQRDARARAAEAWVRAGEPERARRWLDAPGP